MRQVLIALAKRISRADLLCDEVSTLDWVIALQQHLELINEVASQFELNTYKSKIHHATMESWNYPKEQYELVISRLAIHYLQDLNPIFDSIRSALFPNGQFIFSVQHPVLTSSMNSATTSERKSDWIVDNYFEIGKRVFSVTETCWIYDRGY